MAGQPKTSPLLIIALVGIFVAAAIAALVTALVPARPQVTTTQIGPTIGGPFQLVDQTGTPRDQQLLTGKWSAVFFGYTACPDVCPMTMQALSEAHDLLGAQAHDFQIVFISVDPARDSPGTLKAWLQAQALPAGTVGLTGSKAQVDAAVAAYHAFAGVTGSGDKTEVSHSSTVYLMDPSGKFAKPLLFNQPPDQLAAQIRSAMKGA